MVISMLTPKLPVLAAIALLPLFPDAALAQARSSAGGSPASVAAPSPRLSAPTTTLPTTPRVSPGSTTPRRHRHLVAHAFGRVDTAGGRAGNDRPGSPRRRCRPCPSPCPASSRPAAAARPTLPSHLAPRPGAAAPASRRRARPGGGGKALADCMGFWDAATHMSKVEWRAACKRSMQEFPDVKW